MKRFVIRNYGPSRQFPYKDQHIPISNDCAIETDDKEEAAFFKKQKALTVTDRGSELAPSLSVEPETHKESEVSNEISYGDMTVKELQVLVKDREMKASGLNKAELIQALEDYDKTPVEEEAAVV